MLDRSIGVSSVSHGIEVKTQVQVRWPLQWSLELKGWQEDGCPLDSHGTRWKCMCIQDLSAAQENKAEGTWL